MILREGRQAVITFIDYSAVFDTESQMFLDEALAEAGVGASHRAGYLCGSHCTIGLPGSEMELITYNLYNLSEVFSSWSLESVDDSSISS